MADRDLIERVRKAIGRVKTWDGDPLAMFCTRDEMNEITTIAIAEVLDAMREPSEGMIAVGIWQVEECTVDWTASAACASEHSWQAMLDEFRKEVFPDG